MRNSDNLNLEYEYDHDDIDEVIDESLGSNSFIGLRKVRWKSDADFKLDLRTYYVKTDGTEVAGKGVSFKTPQGPKTLVNALVNNGYADTVSLTKILIERDRLGVVQGICESMKSAEMLDEFSAELLNEYYKPEPETTKQMLDKLLV